MPAGGVRFPTAVAAAPPSAGINPAPHRPCNCRTGREPSPCGAGFMPAGGVRFPTAVAAAPSSAGVNPAPHRVCAAASRRVDNAVLVHHRAGTARLAACWWLAEGLSSQRSDTDLVQRLAHAAPEAALRALVLGGQVDFLVPVDAVGEDDLLAGQA